MTALSIMVGYLILLLALGVLSHRFFRGTSKDYFLASQSIGPVLLLMSVFGTTMTAFAMVGSTGESYKLGIGVYGLMASSSGLIHAAVFFLVGIKLWAFGKRYGYTTQMQFFRDRFESPGLGLLLFPILVTLIVPYLLVGLLGAGPLVQSITRGAFPNIEAFATPNPATSGGVPSWLTGLAISGVVLTYIFLGGVRGAAWANTFQTCVFMILGVVTFFVLAGKLGGPTAASQAVLELHPEKLDRGEEITQLHFFSYMFVPLSVGMFPHLFQHWLTAKSAKTFRLTVIAHPLFIMIVWVPCVLIGVWATSAMIDGRPVVPPTATPNQVLGIMVSRLTTPVLGGLLGAGILAAIMSSLDSQFFCIGTMFTEELNHWFGKDKFTDKQQVVFARGFIIGVVALTYFLSLADPREVFNLGVWCFSGFSSLFPLVYASIYWKRVTKAGAFASVLTTLGVGGWLFHESEYGAHAEYLFLGMEPVATMVVCSAVALVAVSLITKPPAETTLRKFFAK
jgi:SSS family solute:Na+ symporter